MIKDSIRLANVKGYDGNYAIVVLQQGHGSEVDRTLEEVMPTRVNTGSQDLPNKGADVLIAFDHVGDAYLLKVIASDNQPLPNADEPETFIYDNLNEVSIDNIKCSITKAGKMAAEKTNAALGPVELITILIDALTLIQTSTCPPGAVLSNAPAIVIETTKLMGFKKV